MGKSLMTAGAIMATLVLATSAWGQGRSGSHPSGPPTTVGAGSRVGTPSTPASSGAGRDFGTSVRNSARVNRQSSHANEHAIANANPNAGLGSSATGTVILDDAVDATTECAAAPGRAAEAAGSPFNPDGQANAAPAVDLPEAADVPISVRRHYTACAHQPD